MWYNVKDCSGHVNHHMNFAKNAFNYDYATQVLSNQRGDGLLLRMFGLLPWYIKLFQLWIGGSLMFSGPNTCVRPLHNPANTFATRMTYRATLPKVAHNISNNTMLAAQRPITNWYNQEHAIS